MIDALNNAIAKAGRFESKLPPETLEIEGYSGRMGRHFLNNLAGRFQPYVEVGCFRGSTLICAAYDNPGLVVGVDNFTDETQPGTYMAGTRQTLLENMRCHSDRSRPSLLDASCWKVHLTGFQCCFFDGAHTEQDHMDAVTHLSTWMTPQFVFVVDDFNRQSVREGTLRGIAAGNLRIDFELWLGAQGTDDRTGWWNGFGVYVLSKPLLTRSSTFG